MILLKLVLEFYLRNTLKALMWFSLILTGIFAASVIGLLVSGVGRDSVSVNGYEIMLGICLFIVCLNSFKEEFHFFLQHGISRKMTFTGFALHLFLASAVYAIALVAFSALFLWISNLPAVGMNTYTLFTQLYANWGHSVGILSGALAHFLWTWGLFFAAGALGYFLTNLFYRLGKFGKAFVPSVIGLLLFLGLPLLNHFSGGRIIAFIWERLHWLFHGSGEIATPTNSTIFFFIFALVGLAISWLFVRRCQLKK